MKNRRWMFIIILFAIHSGLLGHSEAGTVTWSVKNSGGTVVCSGSGTDTVNLPATCGLPGNPIALEFQGSGGTAKIGVSDQDTTDILFLVNTKIVAKMDLTDYILTFDHTFTPGPTSQTYTPIFYRTHMYGTISGAAPANKITVTSTVEHPVGTVLLTAAPTPAPPPLGFNVWDSPSTGTAMTGDRKITVKVKFSLQNTKNINFPSGRFVKVSAQAAPDCPDDAEEECNAGTSSGNMPISLISELKKILENGGNACLGLSLPDKSCAGVHIAK